jgi:hypothetical protein
LVVCQQARPYKRVRHRRTVRTVCKCKIFQNVLRTRKTKPSWLDGQMQYTYKILRADSYQVSEEQLNRLGQEGWKLVTLIEEPGGNNSFLYYFIREITSPV